MSGHLPYAHGEHAKHKFPAGVVSRVDEMGALGEELVASVLFFRGNSGLLGVIPADRRTIRSNFGIVSFLDGESLPDCLQTGILLGSLWRHWPPLIELLQAIHSELTPEWERRRQVRDVGKSAARSDVCEPRSVTGSSSRSDCLTLQASMFQSPVRVSAASGFLHARTFAATGSEG